MLCITLSRDLFSLYMDWHCLDYRCDREELIT